MKIRIPIPSDEDPLAELCGELGYPSSAPAVANRLSHLLGYDDHFVLVALDESDAPIAWIHAFVSRLVESDGLVEVGGLVVSEKHRGKRIGAELLSRVERWARTRGAKAVRVRSNVVRERAHEFYRGAGYQQIKTSLVFEKPLSEHS